MATVHSELLHCTRQQNSNHIPLAGELYSMIEHKVENACRHKYDNTSLIISYSMSSTTDCLYEPLKNGWYSFSKKRGLS